MMPVAVPPSVITKYIFRHHQMSLGGPQNLSPMAVSIISCPTETPRIVMEEFKGVVSQTPSQDSTLAAPFQYHAIPSTSVLVKIHGGPVPTCALPPASTLFSLLSCCRRDCKDPLRAQQWFFWKAERESTLIQLLTPLYPGVPFQGWGAGEVGRAVTHLATHTHCQEPGFPPYL